MRIVTAGDGKFKALVDYSVQQATRFGHTINVYDYGGLGGIPFPVRHWGQAKPLVVLDAIKRYGELTFWLDADAVLHDRVDEIDTDDYDLGVVQRSPESVKPMSGAFMLAPTKAGIGFAEHWASTLETNNTKRDQPTFIDLLPFSRQDKALYLPKFVNKEIFLFNGLRIKCFPYLYNYIYDDQGDKRIGEPLPEGVKVVHFKGRKFRLERLEIYKGRYR